MFDMKHSPKFKYQKVCFLNGTVLSNCSIGKVHFDDGKTQSQSSSNLRQEAIDHDERL